MSVHPVDAPSEVRETAELLAEIWATPVSCPPLPADLLRSLAHGGGAVHVASGEGGPVGAAAAFFGPPDTRSVYSLIAGARTSDRGVGGALKYAQRVWALERGVVTMRWTFDPLVSRNARFNLVKLGAVGREYVVDFYGQLDDGINVETETDRLTAEWTLTDIAPAEERDVAAPSTEDAEVIAMAPDSGVLATADDSGVWCRVPRDVVSLRHRDPAAADAWRVAVRGVFVPAFADGLVATAMTRDGWYRLGAAESS